MAVTPGAVYTASYHTDTGHYSNTGSYFTADVTNGPLTAPAGNNGVYAYNGTSAAGLFPNNSFNAGNSFADVVFKPQLVA